MKRAFLIMSAALSCSGLAGCSWMSKDPCSGKDADLSNPACVVESKQTYRDNKSRWFCVGHLEAKDWSCASSLEEAQTKHDAMSKAIAQAGRVSTEVDALESAFDLESASAKSVNLPNPRSEQGGMQPNAKPDEGHHVATVIKKLASKAAGEDPLVLKTQLMKRPLDVLVLDTFNDMQLASDAKRAWMARYDHGIESWIQTVGSLQKTMQPIGPMD